MSSRKKRVRKPKVEQKVELPVPVPETEQESEHKQEPEQEPDTEIEDISPKPTDKYKCDICDHTLLYKNLIRHNQSKVHINKIKP